MKGMNCFRTVCILFVGISFLFSANLSAGIPLPFEENWNAETVGDHANQLTHWSYESEYGDAPATDTTVAEVTTGDNALMIYPTDNDSTGITSEAAMFGGTLLSIESEIQLTVNGNGGGVIGFCEEDGPLYGYALAVSRDDTSGIWLDLRKFDGTMEDSFSLGPVHLNYNMTGKHTYRLDAEFDYEENKIYFSTYVDGDEQTQENLNPTDSAPHDFSDGMRFVMAANYGQQAFFDNFNAVPEPATMLLLTVGAAGILHRRGNG